MIDRKEMVLISHVDKCFLDDVSEHTLKQQYSSADLVMEIMREYEGFPSNLDSVVVLKYHNTMLGMAYGL